MTVPHMSPWSSSLVPASPARRGLPPCGRALAANPDGSRPPHLDASSTAPPRPAPHLEARGRAVVRCAVGHGRPEGGGPSAPVRTHWPGPHTVVPRDETVEDRPTHVVARLGSASAMLDLDDSPAGEDIDDTLYRARESRGGVPTLGRGYR